MNLTPEARAVGKQNFHEAVGVTRREFLAGTLAAGVVSGAGLGAMYFKYTTVDKPVRIGILGTGDEGGVLIGALTPGYIEVAAIADIRPFNVHRAFHGDYSSPNALANRPGLMKKYGWSSEDEARKNVQVYGDYRDLIADQNKLSLDGVIVALPLHLHAPASIASLRAGLHVLTEKLMGYDVAACKEMGRVSKQTDRLLATGHQRHYSVLYDNAVDTIRRGLIGDIHHIRAQWHRGNLPGRDSWQPPLPGDTKLAAQLDNWKKWQSSSDQKLAAELLRWKIDLDKARGSAVDHIQKRIAQLEAQIADASVKAENYGYVAKTLANGYACSPLEELIRWRLWERTGGGLMAELGSHQLDASGIFISAIDPHGEKALPLTVQAVGGRSIFPLDRECEDHVYCMYEFPAPGYYKDKANSEVKDPNKKIVVTYSSINGNGFGGYGETVLGTKGTLIVEQEQEVMLFKDADTRSTVRVSEDKGGAAVLDTTASPGSAAAVLARQSLEAGPPSRGYTEEIEHWAWCIRNPDPANLPRCHPKVALGDAVIALTTNIAIRNPAERSRIEFQHGWFDIDSDDTPDAVKPDLARYPG